MIWLILIAAAFAIFFVAKIFKIPKLGNMVLVTGGVKTGKSMMSVWLSYRQYKRNLRKWWFYNHVGYYVAKFFLPKKRGMALKKREKPLYYANVPVAVKNYVPLTDELICREKRFRYGSVIYVCESSLVADSQCIKNMTINEQMLLLNKLIAHETKGGYIFYDTQSISDNHYAVKRCLSTYLYIHHTVKIPFFCLCWVRELKFSEDGAEVNVFTEDVEDTLQCVVVPKYVWKLYDCYCYSAFTDDLPVVDNVVKVDKFGDKKARKIITFRNYLTLNKKFIAKEEEQSESN